MSIISVHKLTFMFLFSAGHSRNKRDSLSDSGSSDIMDLEEGMLLETPLTKKQNCSTRYNNNISNTNVFTVETDVWLLQLVTYHPHCLM